MHQKTYASKRARIWWTPGLWRTCLGLLQDHLAGGGSFLAHGFSWYLLRKASRLS